MITDENRFSHEKSRYERPTFPYRCGRGWMWGRPCHRGPNLDGSCGGVAECTPSKRGDTWVCCREGSAGGPCRLGPLPDGGCSRRSVPCRPRRSLRRIRGSVVAAVFGTMIAVIAATIDFEPEPGSIRASFNSLDPGPLSGAHSNFAMGTAGCIGCHQPHQAGAVGWIQAAFKANDMSGACLGCHEFAGTANAPHNMDPGRAALADGAWRETRCVMCHTEHKGLDADISYLDAAQCSTCHEKKISSFAGDHPPFPKNFPHRRRGAIAFDHVSHFSKHFEGRLKDQAPAGCAGCHSIESAAMSVPVGGFEKNCAACHVASIRESELVLLSLPAFEEDPFDAAGVRQRCGPTPEDLETDDAFFLDYGEEDLAAPLAYALNVASDDLEESAEPVAELLMDIAENGSRRLAELFAAQSGAAEVDWLLAGLNSELLSGVACAWAQKREYEAPADITGGGWYADETSVRYRPGGHMDRRAQAWIEFALSAYTHAIQTDPDGPEVERAGTLRDLMLGDGGVGKCIKCHAVIASGGAEAENKEPKLLVEWHFEKAAKRPQQHYSHGPHINLLGPGTLCTSCHVLNESADYKAAFAQFDPSVFESNFRAIGIETCSQCHKQRQIRQDCALCHRYHRGPGFRKQMMRVQTDVPSKP